MGLIADIKAIWVNRQALKATSSAALQLKETYVKNGWKTSEFWLVLLSNAVAIIPALKGIIPADTASTLVVVINSVYAIVRALTKSGTVAVVEQPK